MLDERFVVITVGCTRCKTKQKVHVAARVGGAQMGDQTLVCINCENQFDVMVPDKILRGPYPA